MAAYAPDDFHAWFPADLDPDTAEAIAAEWWEASPHLASALAWESWAATLPPSPAVASVNTGVQSVTYSPAAPPGDYGAALARAAWHRSQLGTLASVPLSTSRTAVGPVDGWDEDP